MPRLTEDECLHGMPPSWCGICVPRGADVSTPRLGQHGFYGGVTKQDVLADICRILGMPVAAVGVGSSLPSEVFDAAAARAGTSGGSMSEIGEAVARRAGMDWPAGADSRGTLSGGGSTVTLHGLKIMRDALRALTR